MNPRLSARVRRFLPIVVATLSTIAAVTLAIGPAPRGPYDRSLAVLTATLVAVIWYTYATYQGVFGRKGTHLDLAMEYEPSSAALRPIIRNLSDNRVRIRIRLTAYWDALTQVPFDEFYSGGEEVPLEPHSGIGGWLEIGAQNAKVLIVRMQVEWWDDAGQEGTTEPRYWLIELDRARISAVIGAANIATIFGDAEHGLEGRGRGKGAKVDALKDPTSHPPAALRGTVGGQSGPESQ